MELRAATTAEDAAIVAWNGCPELAWRLLRAVSAPTLLVGVFFGQRVLLHYSAGIGAGFIGDHLLDSSELCGDAGS